MQELLNVTYFILIVNITSGIYVRLPGHLFQADSIDKRSIRRRKRRALGDLAYRENLLFRISRFQHGVIALRCFRADKRAMTNIRQHQIKIEVLPYKI